MARTLVFWYVMLIARDLIRVLRFPLQEVSDWISLARPSHLDPGALAEVSLYLAGGSCEVSHSSIHPSAWRNCLENTLRPHERTSLAPRGDRSGFVGPLLAAFGAPIQHPFLISKQFLQALG